MRVGSSVPGILNENWCFVAEDQHDICRRVRELDADARLAVNTLTRQLGIVRHVTLDVDPDIIQADPHNTWIIAFRAKDPETDAPLDGEPDARVLELMRLYDTWTKRNPERAKQSAEAVVRHREQQVEKLIRERARDAAERYVSDGRRAYGIKKNIYVPADLPRGEG